MRPRSSTQLQLAREMAVNLGQARGALGLFEEFLAFWMAQGGEVARHEIGQAARLGDLRGAGSKVVRQVRRGGHDLLEQADHVLPQGLDFGRNLRFDLRDALDARLQERLAGHEVTRANAGDALAEEQQVFLRDADGLVHHADRSDLV